MEPDLSAVSADRLLFMLFVASEVERHTWNLTIYPCIVPGCEFESITGANNRFFSAGTLHGKAAG